MEVLDDVSKQWYSLPPLSHARAGLGLVGVGGRLFAVGGWRNHRYSRSAQHHSSLAHHGMLGS